MTRKTFSRRKTAMTEEQTKALEAYRATLTGKEKIKGKSRKKGIFK